MDSPYLADLVEAFTAAGQAHIQTLKSALYDWLGVHGMPHLPPDGVPLPTPAMPVQWTPEELEAWHDYLASKPRVLWVAQDYSMLVEWLLQTYWSPKWASSMGNWLAVKSTLLGQIEATLAANPPAPPVAAAVAAVLPAALDAAIPLGLPVSAVTRAMTEFAQERCAQLIVSMGDKMRAGIREIVMENQQAVMLGGKLENLEARLFDRFATANRDWRRIAVTETSENAAQGVVAACKPGDKLRRVEQYKGVCAWCAKIDGRIVTVVSAAKDRKDGENEVWPGKTNVGRSSAPRKLVAGRLVDREPDEMWWLAAGAQHPNCRGRWVSVTGIDPSKLSKFMAGVKAKIEKNQAKAAAGS